MSKTARLITQAQADLLNALASGPRPWFSVAYHHGTLDAVIRREYVREEYSKEHGVAELWLTVEGRAALERYLKRWGSAAWA